MGRDAEAVVAWECMSVMNVMEMWCNEMKYRSKASVYSFIRHFPSFFTFVLLMSRACFIGSQIETSFLDPFGSKDPPSRRRCQLQIIIVRHRVKFRLRLCFLCVLFCWFRLLNKLLLLLVLFRLFRCTKSL